MSKTRWQARLILEKLGEDTAWIDRLLHVPSVAAFAAATLDTEAADAIAGRLEELGVGFGYAAAARGPEICFLEAMLERGGEIHVVLPCPVEEFREAKVGHTWTERFDRILKRADSVEIASDRKALEHGLALDYSARITLGLAQLHAARLDTELVVLTSGGEHTWQSLGRDVEHLDVELLAASTGAPAPAHDGLEPKIVHLPKFQKGA